MGAWNTWQALDLESVARYEACVFGIKGDVVSVNGLVGKLGVEVVCVPEGAGRVKVVDSYRACIT
jgi:hypothetical protein